MSKKIIRSWSGDTGQPHLEELSSDQSVRPLEVSDDTKIVPWIAKSRLEWERTVDALPQLVCLLDRSAQVIRVNRTVERWGLGSVKFTRQTSLHAMLHPTCGGDDCQLQEVLTKNWNALRSTLETECTLYDRELDKALQISQSLIRPYGDQDAISASGYVAVIISDVSALKNAENELVKLNLMLEWRVQSRTEQLRQRNNDLEDQAASRRSIDRALSKSNHELARLSERFIRVQERERRKISLELDESISKSLTALKYDVETGLEMLGRNQLRRAKVAFTRSSELVTTVLDDARTISMNLRPSLLDHLGAKTAIQWLCRSFGESHPDIEVLLDCQLDNNDIPGRLVTHTFRIVQEALTGVATYTTATKVLTRLAKIEEKLVLAVIYDGVGFDVESRESESGIEIGIVGMRERARMTGGSFLLDARSDTRSRICVEWDLSSEDKSGEV